MDERQAQEVRNRVSEAIDRGLYLDWNLEELKFAHNSAREARDLLLRIGLTVTWYDERKAKLIAAIELKQAEEQNERRHKENRRIAIFGIVVAATVGLVAAWWNHNRPQPQNANTLQTKTPQEYNQPSAPTQSPTASPTVSATLLPSSPPPPATIPTSTPTP